MTRERENEIRERIRQQKIALEKAASLEPFDVVAFEDRIRRIMRTEPSIYKETRPQETRRATISKNKG